MELQRAVERFFATDGPLARALETFKPRPGQARMAAAVAHTLANGGALVVEAGTGVGKTFAYLVPALLSGERVLLSTATKALQDQLFGRDIPRLLAVLGVPARVALLKGRGSYVCLHRLEGARQAPQAMDPDAMRQLTRLEAWSAHTRSGDLAEVDNLDEDSPIVGLVTSTRENCLGARCPQADRCHVNQARKNAMLADVVVINHHLFFADLNVRESGVAEILPSVRAVIFDEAHQLNDIGIQFLGQQLSTGQLASFGRDLALQGAQWARGVAPWSLMALDLERAIAALSRVCHGGGAVTRRRWDAHSPEGISTAAWGETMQAIRGVLEVAQGALQPVAQASPDLNALHERAVALCDKLDGFSQPPQHACVRWLESDGSVRLVESPLDIAQAMHNRVFERNGKGDPRGRHSWIFTSATLGSDAGMAWFTGSCGLEGAQLLRVESPFDYAAQAALFIPPHMPKPSDASHSACVAMLAAEGAEILGGRTLVLTTTLRAMRSIGLALRQYFSQADGVEVLVQGQSPKRELLEHFCRENLDGKHGCLLVASSSFWEGVDIPGAALQLLVIDKLPFSAPSDPLVQARGQQMEANGKNAFQHLHLPQAAIALKQGAGRLIRSETDRGVLVVCDVRLAQTGYGRKMLAALPAMPVLVNQDQFTDALRLLTTPSTTGPFWTGHL